MEVEVRFFQTLVWVLDTALDTKRYLDLDMKLSVKLSLFMDRQSVATFTAPGLALAGAAVRPGTGISGGCAAGGCSPNINKPLQPNPPKDYANGDEDDIESKGKGKEKAHEEKEA